MASYSTDSWFFRDNARFLQKLLDLQGKELSKENIKEIADLAMEMTANGVFTRRRKELIQKLLEEVMSGKAGLDENSISNFLKEENAWSKSKANW